MSTPAPSVLPAPAAETDVARAEAAIAMRSRGAPARLSRGRRRRVRAGGWHRAARRRPRRVPRAAVAGADAAGPLWPAELLPVVDARPGLGLRGGHDRPGHRLGPGGPHGARERGAVPALVRRGVPVGRGVAGGLGRRRDAGGAARADDGRAHVARVAGAQANEARAAIGRMSIEERRGMGLPDVGWEKVVWGGIGWERGRRPGGERDRSDRPMRLHAVGGGTPPAVRRRRAGPPPRAAGIPLNQPEVVALICDAMLEAARAGATYDGGRGGRAGGGRARARPSTGCASSSTRCGWRS